MEITQYAYTYKVYHDYNTTTWTTLSWSELLPILEDDYDELELELVHVEERTVVFNNVEN